LQTTIWAFRTPLVRLLAEGFAKGRADLLVSVIPHFNREIARAWKRACPDKPFVTLITDMADFPPHFWIEPLEEQHVICGSERAVEQARAMGKRPDQIFATSGMVLRPDFYVEQPSAPAELRQALGLAEDRSTGLLLFGGFGSKAMYGIAERLEAAGLPLQLIVVCGRNEELLGSFQARRWKIPVYSVGFTREVHRLMGAADFLIGKPGPGSVAEAMARQLPVILECNSWTMPQERYNTEWVKEKRVGIVLRNFRDIAEGVRHLIEPATLREFRQNAARIRNRAVFEIPEIFAKLLGEPSAWGESANCPSSVVLSQE